MKKLILFSVFVVAAFASATAQSPEADPPSAVAQGIGGLQPIASFENNPGNPLQEYVKTYRHTTIPREFTGHYYLDKEFMPGTIVVNEEDKSLDVLMRYNSLKDQVEIKLKTVKDSVYVLPSLDNVTYKMPAYTLKFHNFKTTKGKDVDGYFIHYYDGEEVQFIAKPMAYLQDEVEPRSGYDQYKPAHFSVKQFYYLVDENGRLKEVDLKERDFRKVLAKSREMKKYFSSHKVDSAEDVVEMLEFYEQQKQDQI